MKYIAKESDITFIALNTSSADIANNRSLFGIMAVLVVAEIILRRINPIAAIQD